MSAETIEARATLRASQPIPVELKFSGGPTDVVDPAAFQAGELGTAYNTGTYGSGPYGGGGFMAYQPTAFQTGGLTLFRQLLLLLRLR